ncbi:MAG: branched-chain amino acid ABC transporter substrate-binding protein [Mycobacteriaceae bacterium]|nr:branched-chain amino acid ABC transporter substrate-binding protein [Mycobacteriaceae bacterium]
MTSGRRSRLPVRGLAALGFIVLIVAAAALIAGVGSPGYQLIARGEIDENGRLITPDNTVAANPSGSGAAICPPLSIAMAGALTGQDAEVGINIRNGVQLAIDSHNGANAGCQVQLKEFDTGGDPQRVTDFAPQIVADAYTVGVIGPSFSGAADAAGAMFEANGLPAATASASRSSLSERGWKTFFRGVASDEIQGRAAANYLKNTLGDRKICVISDSTPYGDAMALAADEALGGLAPADCRFSGTPDDNRLGQVIGRMRAIAPDAVLRTGSYAGASEFARRLRDAGITSAFLFAQSMASPQFATQAGHSGKDTVLSCPCGPDPSWFTAAYRGKFGRDPGAYSAEGYDLATIMLGGIDAGMLVRPQMLDWMRHYSGQGIARRYKWTDTGELADPTVWIYQVQ